MKNNQLTLKNYQKQIVQFMHDTPRCGVFLQMGCGKTICTLAFIKEMLEINPDFRTLIIAPTNILKNVWYLEVSRWTDFANITIGSNNQHHKKKNILKEYTITTIPLDTIGQCWPYNPKNYDLLVIDESSKIKNPSTLRFKNVKKYIKSPRVILLSGTPFPNSYLDCWTQMYMLDRGESLGSTFAAYQNKYFQSGYLKYTFTITKENKKIIDQKVGKLSLAMKDMQAVLPQTVYCNHYQELGAELQAEYDTLKTKYILNLSNLIDPPKVTAEDRTLLIHSAATLVNKLIQFSSGFLYYTDDDVNTKPLRIHGIKIAALQELLEDNSDANFLIAYNYKAELQMIQKHIGGVILDPSNTDIIKAWNKGTIKLLLANPSSAGMGLNLQQGGSHIIWYSLPWSLENYLQFNARLSRIGQAKTVTISHLIMRNTIDELILKKLHDKECDLNSLLRAMKVISYDL